jgi:hypothetical protein
MERDPAVAIERAMKVREVFMQATAKEDQLDAGGPDLSVCPVIQPHADRPRLR